MKIVKILGGLGNQMFQFALYKALQAKWPEERVLVDLHAFSGYRKHQGFEIGRVFGAGYEEATLAETARLAYPYANYPLWRVASRLLPVRRTMLKEKATLDYEPAALTRPGDTYYDGYWQHEEYFAHLRPQLLRLFAFPPLDGDERNRQAAAAITSCRSCSIHIRRGDYLSDPLRRGTTGDAFVMRAIARMRLTEQPEAWFVFSDDIAWCRAHLAEALTGETVSYIGWNQGGASIHDMHLMSLCRHQIIANSSFSWWAAWLNRNESKTVIGPQVWMSLPHTASPMPGGWIRL